jgi:hypothetical protein
VQEDPAAEVDALVGFVHTSREKQHLKPGEEHAEAVFLLVSLKTLDEAATDAAEDRIWLLEYPR